MNSATVNDGYLSFQLGSSIAFQVISEENSQPYCNLDVSRSAS